MLVPWPSLNAASRAEDLESVIRTGVDLLVVGGGVTGAGIALDAASRGLRVALVERSDLAQGTSRWSSKLVHGGLRYLAHGQLGLARDSARERAILMTRTAPHLIRPLPFLIPSTAGRAAVMLGRLGTGAGDLLRVGLPGGPGSLPRARWVDRQTALNLVPGLRPDAGGGVVFWDGQLVDDARLVLGLARTAAAYGATILTRMQASRLGADGAELIDRQASGPPLSVKARVVVNATGVWAGELSHGISLRPSRGSHLVVPSALLGMPRAALTVPLPGSTSRYVFALPQLDGRTYLGITDEPVDGRIGEEDPRPAAAEIDVLLATINTALARSLRPEDIGGAFAGLRPLVAGAASSGSADLSRRHLISRDSAGVLTITGGKLTTYRAMAEEVVDQVTSALGSPARCRTRRLPLVGAAGRERLAAIDAAPWLVARHGTEAERVVAEGGPYGAERVAPGLPVTVAELRYAVRHELALTVDDLLDRRTRIGLVPHDRSAALPVAEQVLADLNRS
ncbi:MAG: glycerol-3-phosphate dehydrogenase/oxidase [Actinomycetota bacterium]|nr:glycerol-3-phosphate dehydrogenase/oxidase [Actinomycetota bacterium]